MAASVLVHHWRRSAAFVQISGVVFIQLDLDKRVWVSRSCELGWPRCTQGRVLSLLLAINYFPWLMVISEAQQYFFSLEFLVQVSPFFYAPLDSLSVPLLFNEINMTAVLKLCEQSNSHPNVKNWIHNMLTHCHCCCYCCCFFFCGKQVDMLLQESYSVKPRILALHDLTLAILCS